MKFETVKQALNTVSCVSDSMAEHFKNKVTSKQYEVLKNNVFVLEDGDKIFNMYHGCGCGWVEIDKAGKAVDLKYLDSEIAIVENIRYEIWDNEYEIWEDEYKDRFIIISKEHQKKCLTTGTDSQNVYMLEFHTDQLIPLILENGNIRVFVNFSSRELVRF